MTLKNFLFLIKALSCLKLFFFKPMSSAGNIPTSDKTEYLPPKKFLCSIKKRLYLFAIKFKIFCFFFLIMIIFFALYFKMFNSIKFDIVSIVFPDLEIIIKRQSLVLFYFFNLFNFSLSRLSKKVTFFFILCFKKP